MSDRLSFATFLDLSTRDQFGLVLFELSTLPERQVAGIADFGEVVLADKRDTLIVADAFLNIRDWRKRNGLDVAMWYATGIVLSIANSTFKSRYAQSHLDLDLMFLYHFLTNPQRPGDTHLANGFVSLIKHLHVLGTEQLLVIENALYRVRREADESLAHPLLRRSFIEQYSQILQKASVS